MSSAPHLLGPGRGFRLASGFMAGLFVLSAAVQWNDPDPLHWIGLYLTAAGLSGLAATGRLPLAPNALAAAVFLALAIAGSPSLPGARAEAFTSVRMLAAEDEEPRETIGLWLCFAWSAAICAKAWGARR
jgi:hypothetical protein